MKSKRSFRWVLCVVLGLSLVVPAAWAQDSDDSDEQEDMKQVEEVIVVTASRTEQKLHDVPAAITVLTADQIQNIPADDYGDLMRNVPGVNVSQMSARDVTIKSRSATNSLAASQLVLMDNRTLYLDFFGFVMWDFVPLDTREIKQIEVVNGPGSAVWGANAMTGVINLITKRPREMVGTSLTLGAGDFDTLYGSITHAGVSNKLGYKVSASYYEQDPFQRPTGTIPGTVGPTNPNGTQYPPFENKGTKQPKLNLRFDYDASDSTTWTFSGGTAETDGIIHTGIGPFDISSGSKMDFIKVDWAKFARRATFFVNLLDGDATNLLTVSETGEPIAFFFQSETYNLDYSDTQIAGGKHVLTYGATARENQFDLSIAPAGDSRQEFGVFLQDEILLSDKFRWLIGARFDDIDPIGSVTSPRTSLLYSPKPNHTYRISANRAFRAPSMINNFLDITIFNELGPLAPGLPPGIPIIPNDVLQGLVAAGLVPAGVPCEFVLTVCTPFFYSQFPSQAVGNPLVTEERLDAYEIGYVGTYGNGTTFTVSIYRNETTDSIDFFTAGAYTSTNPPSNWPLGLMVAPGVSVPVFPSQLDGLLPSEFSYRNIGETIEEGVEIGLQFRPSLEWSGFVNYSFQEEPELSGVAMETLPNGMVVPPTNVPPEHRLNAGFAYDGSRWFFNMNANYVDEAFWTDVLDSRFWGFTDAFTQVNLGAGVRFGGDKTTLSVQAQNIFDEDIQQHIFGDLIEQKITAQLLFRF